MLAKFIKSIGIEPKNHNIPLDTLVNQHAAIIYLLFFIVISIIILTIIFGITALLFWYKDYFLNNYKNYYINLYIRYQIFLAKIYFIIYPLILISGLFILSHGLYYLATHPIIIK